MNPTEIKALRKALAMNQEELASELGVTQSAVSQWESGIRVPSPMARIFLKKLSGKLA